MILETVKKRVLLPGRDFAAPVGPGGVDLDAIAEKAEFDARDPKIVGFDSFSQPDGKVLFYEAIGQYNQQATTVAFGAAATGAIALSRNMLITGMLIWADPFQHDVTTATITVVEDAVDKLMSGLSVVGGDTYFQLSSAIVYMKVIAAMNQQAFGNLTKEDLATGVANDNQSYQAWYIPFGPDDQDPYDARAGIPASLLTDLNLNMTFGGNQVIATTAANGTIDTATTIYCALFGVTGLPRDYLERVPRPAFTHSHEETPTTTTTFNLLGGRFLKRSTIVNLAVQASNNRPRNDGNLNTITVNFQKPANSDLVNAMRWRGFRASSQILNGRSVGIDRDGSAAVSPGGLPGVAIIDWRRLTHNPWGLDLTAYEDGDVRIQFDVGTTTGSIHVLHEYYTVPDPAPIRAYPPWTPGS